MKKYKITCFTWFFNYENFVRGGVDNLLAQTHPDFEIIIFCGPSEDSTLEICKEYEQKYENIRVIEIEDLLSFRDYLKATKECNSDFVYICDGDDRIPEDALVRLCSRQKESDADMVFGRAWHRNEKNEIYTPDAHKNRVESIWQDNKVISLSGSKEIIPFAMKTFLYSGEPTFTSIWGHLFRRKIFIGAIKDLISRTQLKISIDSDFCICLLRKYNKVELLNEPTYYYTVHQNNGASNYGSIFLFHDQYLDILKYYRDEIAQLQQESLKKSRDEAMLVANQIASRQFIGYYIYNYRLANHSKEKLSWRTKELANNKFIQEILQEYKALPGDSRLIPFLLRKKCFRLVSFVCERRARKRYSKNK